MKKQLIGNIKEAIEVLQKTGKLPFFDMPEIEITYPKEERFGDYTSNVALILAKKIGKNPREIAEAIKSQVESYKSKDFEKVETVASGYINFYLSQKYLQNVIAKINKEKNNFGNSTYLSNCWKKEKNKKKTKINMEFISANPTGPLHLGNGRGGFYGDTLSKILKKVGFEVVNEYYVNDAGEQITKLGHSVLKDEKAVYAGEYIDELNEKYKKNSDVQAVGEKAGLYIFKNVIQKTIKDKMRINFDKWVSEKEIKNSGYVERAIKKFEEMKLTYELDGALWLKTSKFGDDKDRVLIKNNGQKSYFASDCGYILNKIERNFDQIIEIWGADHHGYVNRFRAAAEALGFSKGKIKFIITQLVRLVKEGKEVRMSKRAGNVVYIDELIKEVGHDVTRFFFLIYSPDTHMNFDLGLAKEQSEKNPVFYVQYAHARICSILKKAEKSAIKIQDAKKIDLSFLKNEKELNLMKELNKFPELIEEIAKNYAVHRLPQYAIKLADKFHSFYNDCKVLEGDNLGTTRARLEAVKAVKIVLKETLDLMGIEAPERM